MLMRKIRKFIALCVVGSVIIALLLSLSYFRAKSVSYDVIKPISNELYHYDSSFLPFGYINDLSLPCWEISYAAKERMISRPISIQVDVFGNLIKTNPENLLDSLKKQKNKGQV